MSSITGQLPFRYPINSIEALMITFVIIFLWQLFVHYCFAWFISIVFVVFFIVLYIMLGILNLSVHLNYGTITMFTQIIELLICVTLGHLHSAIYIWGLAKTLPYECIHQQSVNRVVNSCPLAQYESNMQSLGYQEGDTDTC